MRIHTREHGRGHSFQFSRYSLPAVRPSTLSYLAGRRPPFQVSGFGVSGGQ